MIFDIRNSITPLVRDGELSLQNSIIISLNIDHPTAAVVARWPRMRTVGCSNPIRDRLKSTSLKQVMTAPLSNARRLVSAMGS